MSVRLAAFVLAAKVVVVGSVEVLMLAVVVAVTVSGSWVIFVPVPPLPWIFYPGLCCWWVLSVWLRCVDGIMVVHFPN